MNMGTRFGKMAKVNLEMAHCPLCFFMCKSFLILIIIWSHGQVCVNFVFQRLMAGDDAANQAILNEITVLVSLITPLILLF